MYTLTTAYDGEKPFHSFQFSDALAAFTVYLDIKDWERLKNMPPTICHCLMVRCTQKLSIVKAGVS